MIKQLFKLLQDLNFKILLLRISIGVVYIWFGALKFIPNLSPAESIAKDTIQFLTFDLLPLNIGFLILAIWEVTIGVLLISNFFKRFTVIIALVHLMFTFTPLFVFTKSSFEIPPYTFTLLGQYIFKNIVIICALLIVFPLKKIN